VREERTCTWTDWRAGLAEGCGGRPAWGERGGRLCRGVWDVRGRVGSGAQNARLQSRITPHMARAPWYSSGVSPGPR